MIELQEFYRYRLTRANPRPWAGEKGAGVVLFIMLNPSTANEQRDDPTIRRCMGFAWDWGYLVMKVVNLFAMRATDPRKLRTATRDPIGHLNPGVLRSEAAGANTIVAAWGAGGSYLGQDEKVKKLLGDYTLCCLGKTAKGHPRHPLFVRRGKMLEAFQEPSP